MFFSIICLPKINYIILFLKKIASCGPIGSGRLTGMSYSNLIIGQIGY